MEYDTVYGVDPGTLQTGWVLWHVKEKRVVECGIADNHAFLERLRNTTGPVSPLYIEMIACYGMPVGKETFQTVVWIGRFVEVCSLLDAPWHLCYRLHIKTHHCRSARAKDANISQALRDKYGVVGTKKLPGPLYGVKSHIWSALAIATYAAENNIVCACKIE